MTDAQPISIEYVAPAVLNKVEQVAKSGAPSSGDKDRPMNHKLIRLPRAKQPRQPALLDQVHVALHLAHLTELTGMFG
jgi:hypothetical protein